MFVLALTFFIKMQTVFPVANETLKPAVLPVLNWEPQLETCLPPDFDVNVN